MGTTSKNRKVLNHILWLVAALILSAGCVSAAEWKIETVDQTGPGRFASMQVDRDGNVHVAYIPEIPHRPLKYAYWDHLVGRWFDMTVAANASFCTLVLDSKQQANISFADNGTVKGTKLRYAHWDGTKWDIQPVSPPVDAVVAYYTSIALNSKDEPSLTYYDYQGPGGVDNTLRLRSVFRKQNAWEVYVVDPARGSGKFNSIAIDSKDRPHVAYANVRYETSGLRYARWDGEQWNREVLEGATGSHPVLSVAMILDKNDNPHIVYTDVVAHQVKHATRRKGGPWQIEVVDHIVKEGYPDRYGIAMDDQGNPYISYYDLGTGAVKLAFRRNGKWYGEVVSNTETGYTSSLQIHDGTIWLAYADDIGGSLKVAHRPLVEAPPVPVPPPALRRSVAKSVAK
jgi:hypothetical protein